MFSLSRENVREEVRRDSPLLVFNLQSGKCAGLCGRACTVYLNLKLCKICQQNQQLNFFLKLMQILHAALSLSQRVRPLAMSTIALNTVELEASTPHSIFHESILIKEPLKLAEIAPRTFRSLSLPRSLAVGMPRRPLSFLSLPRP